MIRRSPLLTLVAAAGVAGAQLAARSPVAGNALAPRVACSSLEGRTIPAKAIGLPTTGATVTAAVIVPPSPERVNSGQVVLATPEYCKVTGSIAPVDPQAPDIKFHINLPTAWNGKTIQLGGSGPNGVIPVALTTGMQWGPESIPPNAPYALSRGFVTYGSDSGHQVGGGRSPAAGAAPSDWYLNQEALTNYAYAQLKKTHDVTFTLIEALYGRPPRHSYFMGSSTGGREALMVAQRFPQDYDGVFSQVPVHPFGYLGFLDEVLRTQSQAGDAWIPRAKVAVIGKEVLRQCDDLDGLADGLVSHYTACNAKFDPAVSPNAFAAVRCPDGRDTGETCLSDPQIKAANAMHATVELPFPLANGWTSIPGWTTGGELPTNWKIVNAAPGAETRTTGMLAGLIVRDPNLPLLDFKPANYRARLQELSALLDATDPDLSAFRRRGGKLLMKVNTTDYAANPRWSYAYYQKVVDQMGQAAVDSFVRFYVAVGIFHNRNIGRNPITNELVPSYIDFIAMLDDWVETGKPPADRQVLASMDTAPPFAVKSSFPMCRYPQYPRYKGSGDPKVADSYTCAR
jgi:feruloyl esterase